MPSNNHFIHSSAGTGKTTKISKLALRLKSKKILITTYTIENTQEIIRKIEKLNGFVPKNIEVITWYNFLLRECIRPYQNKFGIQDRINSIIFVNSNSVPFIKEELLKHYVKDDAIYSDKLSKFAYYCNIRNDNCVIKRLEKCYDFIFIDEAQDLSGYDFSLVNSLLNSNCFVTLVGDARQDTFNTSPSYKDKKFSKNILMYFEQCELNGLGKLYYMNRSWRCNDTICKFSDKLFPDFPKTLSNNFKTTNHDGIFLVNTSDLDAYCKQYNPQILLWSKASRNKIGNRDAINIGISKGCTYDRVLIVPTTPMLKFLQLNILPSSPYKFYIAVTRARYSVSFLIDKEIKCCHPEIKVWKNDK